MTFAKIRQGIASHQACLYGFVGMNNHIINIVSDSAFGIFKVSSKTFSSDIDIPLANQVPRLKLV